MHARRLQGKHHQQVSCQIHRHCAGSLLASSILIKKLNESLAKYIAFWVRKITNRIHAKSKVETLSSPKIQTVSPLQFIIKFVGQISPQNNKKQLSWLRQIKQVLFKQSESEQLRKFEKEWQHLEHDLQLSSKNQKN